MVLLVLLAYLSDSLSLASASVLKIKKSHKIHSLKNLKVYLMAKILVIDDNAVIREVVTFTLQNHHDLTLAKNGKEGVELAKTSEFDVIITDIKMPEMDGIEFVKEIRKVQSYAQTPILIVTANIIDNKQKMKDSGATGWILKPFDPEKLLEMIDKVLR